MQKIITRAAILALLATGAQASAPTSIQPTDAVKAPAATPLLQEARRGRARMTARATPGAAAVRMTPSDTPDPVRRGGSVCRAA